MAPTAQQQKRRKHARPRPPSVPIVEQEWQVERFIDTLACAAQLRHMLTYPQWKETDLAALVQDKWHDAQGVKREDFVQMLVVYRRKMLTDKSALSSFYQRVMMEQLKETAFDLKDVMREQHMIYSVQRDRVMEMRSEEVTNGFPMTEVGNEIKIASSLLSEMRDSALEMQKQKEKAPPPEPESDDMTEIEQKHGAGIAELVSNAPRRSKMMQTLSTIKQIISMKEGRGDGDDDAIDVGDHVHPSQRPKPEDAPKKKTAKQRAATQPNLPHTQAATPSPSKGA